MGSLLLPASLLAKPIPNFWIKNLEGQRFDTKKHKGPFVVSFFFVGCVPCIKEIPALHAFMKEEFPDTGLLFVDPIREDSQSEVEDFAARLNVPESFFYRDPLSRLLRKFFREQIGYPTIVGVNNRVLLFRMNGINENSLVQVREALSK